VRKRKVDLASRPPVIKIGDASIKFKNSFRYLGVDQGMGIKNYCKKLGERIETLFANLGRLAKATYGALSTIYREVFAPMVAYAEAEWTDFCTERDPRTLKGVQRKAQKP